MDDRHQQHPASVLTLHVDRQPEVQSSRDPGWHPVDPVERHRHRGLVPSGAHDGKRDHVRVGHLLRPAGCLDRLVELAPPLVQNIDPQGPKAGGGGNLEALLHVLHHCSRRATEWDRPGRRLRLQGWRRPAGG